MAGERFFHGQFTKGGIETWSGGLGSKFIVISSEGSDEKSPIIRRRFLPSVRNDTEYQEVIFCVIIIRLSTLGICARFNFKNIQNSKNRP